MLSPMLCADAPAPDDLADLIEEANYSIAPKFDGFRVMIDNGVARLRSGAPVPNAHIQAALSGLPHGLDGELCVGDPTAPDVFRRTQSMATRHDGAPDFALHAFDLACESGVWRTRFQILRNRFGKEAHPHVRIIPHRPVETASAAMNAMRRFIAQGYEGAVLRNEDLRYRAGRPVGDAPPLIRLKDRHTAEAVMMRHAGRAIEVKTLQGGIVFHLAAGLTDADLDALRPGDVLTFDHLPHGAKDKPRQPVFRGLRSRLDL